MNTESKYLLDYDAYVKERPGEVDDAWAEKYKAVVEGADNSVYSFIMSYIFM